MTEVTYDYPKSSCSQNTFELPQGVQTNMSVRGCNFSPYYNRLQFNLQQEPTNKRGMIILNPEVVSKSKFDPNFKQIDSKLSMCNDITYINSDPRLYNAASADRIQLDRPPLNSTPKLNTLSTNKELDAYGQNFKSYKDVNSGQVMYYISKDIQDSLYTPLFSSKVKVVGTLYRDPMGNIKPEYNRIPESTLNPIKREPCHSKGDYCLSWINDSQFHREDLLSKQMAIRNQQRFQTRWSNTNFK
jgi:hypothetical protein